MELKIHRNIFRLKKHWDTLNPNEYNSFAFWKLIWLRSPIYLLPRTSSLVFLEVIENSTPVLIIPLCKKLGKNKFFSFSRYNGTFKFDFIYNKCTTTTQLAKYIDFALNHLNASEIILDKIISGSKTHSALQNLQSIKFKEFGTKSISIENITEYNLWYNSLSKNSRQNLRTAYNRINSDNFVLDFEFYDGKKIPKKQLYDLIDLYCDRHIIRYGLKVSFLKRIYLKHFDFSTTFLQKSNNSFYAILKINEKLAAFMAGIKEEQAYRIPRLSIDEQFSRYSPGIILLNETIKTISSSSKDKGLDLGIGDERYKKQMGGNEYQMMHMEYIK
jgi:hypothetical protein